MAVAVKFKFVMNIGFLVLWSFGTYASLEPPPNTEPPISGAAALLPTSEPAVLLYSVFNWAGLNGNVTFAAHTDAAGGQWTRVRVWVKVADAAQVATGADVAGGSEVEGGLQWGVHELPVRYDGGMDRCSPAALGKRLVDLSVEGLLQLPLTAPMELDTQAVTLVGPSSVFGRSLVLEHRGKRTCANIHGVGREETYEARFFIPLGGSVWFRLWKPPAEESSGAVQTTILSDVFNTQDDSPVPSEHDWRLFITDILDSRDYGASCNHLSRVYDPVGRQGCDGAECPQGLLGRRHGDIRVAERRSSSSKKLYASDDLEILEQLGGRDLFLGVMDTRQTDHIWGCAKLRKLQPKEAHAIFNNNGVRGNITFRQPSPFAPTDLTFSLRGLPGSNATFHVNEMPFKPPQHKHDNACKQTLRLYNPHKVSKDSPAVGSGSHEQYASGDLSGKHGRRLLAEAVLSDHNLPLHGTHSVMGRSVVIGTAQDHEHGHGHDLNHKHDHASVCANIRNNRTLRRASVIFRYPIVGEILMEQDEEDELDDTTMIIGPLVYSDGNHNTTSDHDFRIHVDPPGKDYFNWTGRCLSAGRRFNPHHISTAPKVYRWCGPSTPERCEAGDLSTRLGPLGLAGTIGRGAGSRRLVTDTNTPLGGRGAVTGHSVVISDRHAPEHRGDRMACARVNERFRHKAVVHEWSWTKGTGSLSGLVEFTQETPYDVTQTYVNIKGLEGKAKKYHVHLAPVEPGLEYPCEGSTVYGHYNPLGVAKNESYPAPLASTHDEYELGDLSSKYGELQGLDSREDRYQDSNLPLFGHTSILGRSVVIHKAEKDIRWFCGNLEWGYARSEATQVSAIVSFHHPKGFAWGYVRMRQLVYRDGSTGETFIEVNLRHPGTNNRNVTRGHNWSVYVNQVSVDAAVKFYQSRCVAGGYRWNPYLIHLAQPNAVEFYDQQCTPSSPLRCEVGDLSGRLGPVDIGNKRQVFVDSNLPLAGPHSAMGRSLVLHGVGGRVERYACANIEPDDDVIKWLNVRRNSRFNAALFMMNMREVLGAPKWFLAMDPKTVKQTTDGECANFLVHFMGPQARQLEQDFTRLLSGGQLHKPTVSVLGVVADPKRKTKVAYRSCAGLEDTDLDRKAATASNIWGLLGSGGVKVVGPGVVVVALAVVMAVVAVRTAL